MMEFYSGGAIGADFLWEQEISNLKLKNTNFYIISFNGHNVTTNGYGKIIRIPDDELNEVNKYYIQACQDMNKNESYKRYTRNLLRRNFYQVLDADCVVAVLDKHPKEYTGGTTYAFEYAKQLDTPIFAFYDDVLYYYLHHKWLESDLSWFRFHEYESYTLIGSRNIKESDMKKENIQKFLDVINGTRETKNTQGDS